MGWTQPYHTYTKESLIEHIKNHSLEKDRILDTHVSGKQFWVLYNHKDGNNYLFIYLLQKGYKENPQWMYKDMDTTCGVYYWDCPKRMVDKAVFSTEHCKDWLKTWQELHSKEHKNKINQWKKLQPNDKFYIGCENPREYIFVREYSKQSIVGRDMKTNNLYRFKKNQVLINIPEQVS